LSNPRKASDALDPGLLEYYKRSRERYGLEAIGKMKGVLARGALEGKTIVETWEELHTQLELPERAQDTGKILVLVHVLRGDDIRVISFRAASKSEQRDYREWLKTRE